jgi:hypothetical protein
MSPVLSTIKEVIKVLDKLIFVAIVLGALISILPVAGGAQSDFTIFPSVIDASGGMVCGEPVHDLLFSLGETVVGESANGDFTLWAGFKFLREITVLCPEVSGVDSDPSTGRITETRLYPAYPNPFTGSVRLRYDIGSPTETRLVIYDLQGREVKVMDHGFLRPGGYEVYWDGRDNDGGDLASGVYFSRLTAGDTEYVKRFVLLR